MDEETLQPTALEEGIECPACGYINPPQNAYCEQCGENIFKLSRMQRILDIDPDMAALNRKYVKLGKKRFISSLVAIVSLFTIFQWLENDLFGFAVNIALFAFPIASILFIYYCIRRGLLKRKMLRILNAKANGEVAE